MARILPSTASHINEVSHGDTARTRASRLRIIQPKVAIPIHYNDYTLFKSPLSDFQHAMREAGLEEVVRYLSHGDTYGFEVPRGRLG